MHIESRITFLSSIFCIVSGFTSGDTSQSYKPTWESLDSRPLPSWYDDVKFGIFLHWGAYSAPAYCGAGLWYYYSEARLKKCVEFMQKNYPPDFVYADFAPMFKAELFDPKQWAEIFTASGAKYVVLTSKHHEGYDMWPSKYSFNWNSMDVGPKKDLVGELAAAIRNYTDMKFGLYHSLLEFYNPLLLQDQANHFKTRHFAEQKSMPELYELVTTYKPDIVWSDGNWVGTTDYWQSKQFLAWLYNESPVKDTVVTNDRWGNNTLCHHGGFYTCLDRYNPGVLQQHKWENCMTVDRAYWAYERSANLSRILSAEELVQTLVETVSCGGNLLMDVGPTGDGRIVPIFEERLRQVGQWLKIYGEGIYKSKPWRHQNDTVTPKVWYTSVENVNSGGTSVFAYSFNWPRNSKLILGAISPTDRTTVQLLGYKNPISWEKYQGGGIVLNLPIIPVYEIPSEFVWGFKLTNVL